MPENGELKDDELLNKIEKLKNYFFMQSHVEYAIKDSDRREYGWL